VLKQSCEAFIMGVTKLLIEPLLGFLAKATAARMAPPGGAAGGAAAKALRGHAFAAPGRVAELLGGVQETMTAEFPLVAAKARRHLAQQAHRDMLLRPVKSNVAEACSQARRAGGARRRGQPCGRVAPRLLRRGACCGAAGVCAAGG